MLDFLFDFFKKRKKEFYERTIDLTLEELVDGMVLTKTKLDFNGSEKEILVLPVEFRKDKAIGIFSYKKGRIEIPIGFEFKKKFEDDYEPITITENTNVNNLGRCEGTIYLRLIPANLETKIFSHQDNINYDVQLIYLDHPFAPLNPLSIYFVDLNRDLEGLHLDEDNEIDFFTYWGEIKLKEELEQKYILLKHKPLYKNVNILPSEYNESTKKHNFKQKLTEEDIQKLNDWANRND